MSSPKGSLFKALQREMGQGNEYGIFIDDTQHADMLKAVFSAYYKNIPAGDVVFSKPAGFYNPDRNV